MIGFTEKPKSNPKTIPGDPTRCLASMGNYLFTTDVLVQEIVRDAGDPNSAHDFGKSIVAGMYERKRVYVYDFATNEVAGQSERERGYWRDVGNLDAYYQANMDLVDVVPVLNLYDKSWPIRTLQPQLPPPKFVHYAPGPPGEARRGEAVDSMVCAGSIISGGHVRHSVLSPNVRVNSYAVVQDSILFEGVKVGRQAKVRRAIIDKDVEVPEHAEVGYDLELDRRRGFTVTDSGIVVIPKGETAAAFLRG